MSGHRLLVQRLDGLLETAVRDEVIPVRVSLLRELREALDVSGRAAVESSAGQRAPTRASPDQPDDTVLDSPNSDPGKTLRDRGFQRVNDPRASPDQSGEPLDITQLSLDDVAALAILHENGSDFEAAIADVIERRTRCRHSDCNVCERYEAIEARLRALWKPSLAPSRESSPPGFSPRDEQQYNAGWREGWSEHGRWVAHHAQHGSSPEKPLAETLAEHGFAPRTSEQKRRAILDSSRRASSSIPVPEAADISSIEALRLCACGHPGADHFEGAGQCEHVAPREQPSEWVGTEFVCSCRQWTPATIGTLTHKVVFLTRRYEEVARVAAEIRALRTRAEEAEKRAHEAQRRISALFEETEDADRAAGIIADALYGPGTTEQRDSVTDWATEIVARLSTLESSLQAAEQDKERLDWLDARMCLSRAHIDKFRAELEAVSSPAPSEPT